jgi:hypothetical protein
MQAWSTAFIEISRMLSSAASSGEFCWHSRSQDNSRARPLPHNIFKEIASESALAVTLILR